MQNVLVPIPNQQALMMEYENLGKEIQQAQQSFTLSVRTTIQHACEIGRIAYEARECIRNLPTKAEKAKLEKVHVSKLDYRKPTFEQWIETYTGIGKDTIYSMIRLYEKLQANPDYEIPEEMGWNECLGFFSDKPKLSKTEDVTEDENEDDADLTHEKFKSERQAFNKMYETVDQVFAKFLDTSENDELKEITARWKNQLTNDISSTQILCND